LLCDPQTSGGLLVSCAADKAATILGTIKAAGYPAAAVIGRVDDGQPQVVVEA
jgi:selenide,water dikinase